MKFRIFLLFSFYCYCLFSSVKSSASCGDSVMIAIKSYNYSGDPWDKEVSYYDSLGREYSKTYYSWNSISWILDERKLTTYWNDTLVYEVNYQSWLSGQWLTYRLQRYLYNNNGYVLSFLDSLHNLTSGYTNIVLHETVRDTAEQPLQITNRHWNGTSWINNDRYTYAYDSLGRDTLYIKENGDSLGWVNYLHQSFTFDTFGNNDSRTDLKWDSGQWTNQFRTLSWFQGLEQDTLTITQNGQQQTWNNTSIHQTVYDIFQNIIYELGQSGQGNGWINSYQRFNFYTDSLIDSSLFQTWNAATWTNNSREIYSYDSLSRLVTLVSQSFTNGIWTNQGRHVNYYLASGRIDYETDDYWVTQEWETSCFFTPIYNGNGELQGFESPCYQGCSSGNSYNTYDSDSILTYSYWSHTSCGGNTSYELIHYYYNQVQGDSIICDSGSTVLTAYSCPGYTYYWNTGETTQVITVTASGTYTVNISNGSHHIYTAPFEVFIISSLGATHDPDSTVNLCGNTTYTVIAPLVPFATYVWLVNGSIDTLSDYNNHPEWRWIKTQISAPGSYQVIVSTPCGTDTSSITYLYFHPQVSLQVTAAGPTSFCPGDSVMLSATAGFASYLWTITNDTTVSTYATASGYYSVTISDTNGCVASTGRSVTVLPLPVMPVIEQEGPQLYIADSAAINNWFQDSALVQTGTSGSYLSPQTGWYYVQAYTTSGCTISSLPFYFDPTVLTAQAGINKVICDNDSVILGGNFPGYGGTPPYIFSWLPIAGLNDPASSNPHASPDSTTTYFLTVTDFAGNTVSDSVTVLVHPLPLPVVTSYTGPDICAGIVKQFRAITAGAQTYTWYSDSIAVQQANSPFYNHAYNDTVVVFVVVSTQYNCIARSADYVLNVHPYPAAVTMNNPGNITLCNGDSILIVASNLDASAAYEWKFNGSQFQTSINDSSLYAGLYGTYSFVETSAFGCATVSSIYVRLDSVFRPVLITDRNSFCEGDSTLLYSAEIPGYNYEWLHDFIPLAGADSSAIWVTESGEYVLYLSSNSGCEGHSLSEQFTVNQLPSISIYRTNDTLLFAPMIFGAYQWFAFGDTTLLGTDSYFIPPHAGDYYVVVSNIATGCTGGSQSFHYLSCSTSITKVNLNCAGVCNGSISATPVSGYAPFSYLWNTGDTSANIDSLCAGNYSLTMADDSGCTATYYITVSSSPIISMTVSLTPASCFGECSGSAIAVAGGGVSPYSYVWNNGAVGDTLSNLCSGQYYVIVTDANLCHDTTNVNISQPLTINAAFTGVSALCNGACDGSYTLNVSGGSPPYQYSICGGGTLVPGTLCAGNYCVTITDNHGCVAPGSFIVNEPSPLVVASTIHSPTCIGCTDGYIIVNSSGGTFPYVITWNPAAGFLSGDTIFQLSADTYSVIVTDINGCSSTIVETLVDMPDLVGNSFDEKYFTLYPNPVTGYFQIATGKLFSTGEHTIKVYDTLGKLLLERKFSSEKCDVNITSLSSGLYRVDVSDGKISIGEKLIKIADE